MAARGAPALSDSQLREELIRYGYNNPVPITGTTRSLLLKKLEKLKNEKKNVSGKSAPNKISSPKIFALSSDESEGEAMGNSRGTAPVSATRRRSSGARTSRPAPKITKRLSVGGKTSQSTRKTSSRRSFAVGTNDDEGEDDVNDDESEKSGSVHGRGHDYRSEKDLLGLHSTNTGSKSRTLKGGRRSHRQERGEGDGTSNRVNGEQVSRRARGEFSDSDEEVLHRKGVKLARTKKHPIIARTSDPFKFSKVKDNSRVKDDDDDEEEEEEDGEEDEDDSASDNSGKRNTFVVDSSKDRSRKEDSGRGRWNFLSRPNTSRSDHDSPPQAASNTSRSRDNGENSSSNWTFFTSRFNSSRTSTPRKASASRDDTTLTYHSLNPGNSSRQDTSANAAATPISGRPTLRGSTLDASSSNHASFHGQTPPSTSGSSRREHSTPAPNENVPVSNAQTLLREQPVDEAQIFATEENLGSSWRTKYSHFVSKVLLGSVCLFFVILGLMYLGVNSTVKSRHVQIADITGGDDVDYSGDELPLLMGQALHDRLSEMTGEFLCGKSPVKNMTIEEAKIFLDENLEIQKKKSRLKPFWVSKNMPRTLQLITSNPQWGIRLFNTQKELVTEYTYDNDIKWLDSSHVYMTLFCQVKTTAMRLLFWATILVVSLLVLWPGVYLVRYQMHRKEKERQEVTQLVDKIIEVLANHQQACYQEKTLTPYLAIPHVRDTLIAPAERHKKQHLWQKAVQFLNVNESRVRVETQQVAGEEFAVWRWVQPSPAVAVTSFLPTTDRHMNPKRAKVWQGTAFANLDSAVKASAYSYTPCLKVRNMFDPTLESGSNWHVTIQDAILERCGEDSGIMHIVVDKNSREGCVYVKCLSAEKAGMAFRCLQGSWFDGKLVTVKYIRLDRYHQRFPSALNVTSLLQPSNNLRMSLQSPPSTSS